MSSDKNYITPSGLKKLKEEYHQLLSIERPKLLETIAWAASNGDRSENADYIYGKRRLREIDKRLRFLGERLDKVEVVNPSQIRSNKVVFGATITVQNEDEQEFSYQIVGEDEFDIKLSRISCKSPVAKALLGTSVGAEAEVVKPEGREFFTILRIEYK